MITTESGLWTVIGATRAGNALREIPYDQYQCWRCGIRRTINTSRRTGPKPDMCVDCIQVEFDVDRNTARLIFKGEAVAA